MSDLRSIGPVMLIGAGKMGMAYMSASLTEMARDDTMAARAVRTATRNRRQDGVVLPGEGGAGPPANRPCQNS